MGGHLLLHPFGIVLEELREQLVVLLLCQLESVRQADAAVRQVGFPTGDVMEYNFNVHIGDIIGQQHDFIAMDFIQVLALHVLRADKAGLQQSCDERACSYWKSHATLTLLAKQDLPTFGYNMIAPLKSWCWGSILFYPFNISRFS